MRTVLLILLPLLMTLSAKADDEQPDYAFNAADAYYDEASMRAARVALRNQHGAMTQFMIMADRLEYHRTDSSDAMLWDAEGWYGGDIDKVVFKSSGLVSLDGEGTEEAELQLLWSRAITPFFDLRTGVRYDLEPSGLGYAVIGVKGLAPYLLDLDAAAYMSADGDLTADIEIEYEWLFTQRIALLSRTEIEFSAQRIPELGTGSGLTDIAQSLSLHYAISRQLVPYLGVEWSKAFGGTADLIKAAGEDDNEFSVIAGIHFWF